MMNTLETIERGRVVAIVRGDYAAVIEEAVEAMMHAGVTAVEVTLNSPGALASIASLAVRFGEQVAIGAGTVMTPDEVERVADAGGQFIVSPNLNPAVIEQTKSLGLVSLPGCYTPTEIVAALAAGADAAKLFPATLLGPAFVKAVRAPLGDVRLVPTGGVTPELARAYRAAGAWGVGIGSELVGKYIFEPDGLARLRARATEFVAAMKGGEA